MLSRRLIFLASVLIAACAASRNEEPPERWRVEVRTSGGITGSGVGNYAVSSDGKVEVTTMQRATCSFTATADELRRFAELVAKAKPERWAGSYVPSETCCDRIEYTLTLDAGRVTTVKWIDQPLPMPADLAALAEAITGGAGSLRVTYDPRCSQQSR